MTRQRAPFTLATDAIPRMVIRSDNTAFIIQDLTGYFADPSLGLGAVARKRGIFAEFEDYYTQVEMVLNNVPYISEAARTVGIPHIYLVMGAGEGQRPSRLMKTLGASRGVDAQEREIVERVKPATGDIVLKKPGYGAFVGTDLVTILNQMGIENLIVSGVMTEFGIRSTVFSAQDLGYRPLVVSDATASATFESQQRAMQEIPHGLIKVRGAGEVVQTLERLSDEELVLV